MIDDVSANTLTVATQLLARVTTPDGYQYLVMSTGELVELLSAAGIERTAIDAVMRQAVSENGAEKLARLDSWRPELHAD